MDFLKSKKGRFLALALAIILGVGGVNYGRNSGFQKMESAEDKFSMNIPKEWTIEYADPQPTVDVSGGFAFDETQENFIFVIVSPTETMDYEKDLADWQKQFAMVDFKFLSSEGKKINGQEVMMYDASVMNGDTPYYQKGFITYANGNKYIVLTQCREDMKDNIGGIFEKCLNSFKIKK